MDFPLFHLDFFGNRMLIAVIAIVHVLINHALAVGLLPLVTLMEWWGYRQEDRRWDDLARKILWVSFIVTTTLGALTGVGIWLSTSLVNPLAIGSLIRVFFWAWFAEWIVFVTEVCLILAYFLLWKSWGGDRKHRHIRLGILLSVVSWLTMAVIVAILGFMMDPGSWQAERSFLSAVMNPLYLPQLAFRTPMAMVMGGVVSLFLLLFFTRKGDEIRDRAQRFVGLWMMAWLPLLLAGSIWYRSAIPAFMTEHFPVALATMEFQDLYRPILNLILASVVILALTAVLVAARPRLVPGWVGIVPLTIIIVLTAQFERTREFIRKPYVLGGYVYANGVRVSDYPLLLKEGILTHSAFASVRSVTPENQLEAGREVFVVACSRCHTLNGVNSVQDRLSRMYGTDARWDAGAVDSYLNAMFSARPFMPPFPGSPPERRALAEYLVALQTRPDALAGAQTSGASLALR